MNDYMFYVIGLIFIFILWLYSGGPTHPISFSGPYITPVTDTGVTQVGYGDSGSTIISRPAVKYPSANDRAPDSTKSDFAGLIKIGPSRPESRTPGSEYISIRSNANNDVEVTGWQLVSANGGTQVRVPDGSYRGRKATAVRLSPGDNVVLISSTRSNSTLKDAFPNSWNIYLGERNDIWDDSNNTITLIDASGKVVDQYKY